MLAKLEPINSSLETRARVEKLETEMLKCEQVSCPVIHRFGPGTYIREVMIPAGTFSIGHHQNFEHMNIMLKGRVTMLNDDQSLTELTAPMIFVAQPGRKVGYIHEDMVWLNVYPTNETNIEKLEAHYLTKSAGWIEGVKSLDGIKLLEKSANNSDYELMLKEIGMTEEVVRAQSENQDDMTDLPYGGFKIKEGNSNIEGKGIFATAAIEMGELIAPARINGKRTIAGRFTNHSPFPNAEMIQSGNDIHLVALRNISGCHGGLDGEEITINYRDAIKVNLKIAQGE